MTNIIASSSTGLFFRRRGDLRRSLLYLVSFFVPFSISLFRFSLACHPTSQQLRRTTTTTPLPPPPQHQLVPSHPMMTTTIAAVTSTGRQPRPTTAIFRIPSEFVVLPTTHPLLASFFPQLF
ncbi:hypothetical protein BDN72DRAFT_96527 [Pluteus cervinus]|uniref:Uncharacterized protein n=1 Tax=Pluteus cervinus TaxID=181527 RepID=A0ACD2ZY05_9AGAR|nr:hypothetical protein BDN72DRAFT_96527 [Pluteus cervinus]